MGGISHLEPYIKEVMTMDKQSIQFATVKQDNIIQRVGRSILTQPKSHYEDISKTTKWFDDSTIIKKESKKLG